MTATRRLRREPPAFRHVEVRHVEHVGPRLVRVTLSGSELAGFTVEQPAASVRVLLPSSGAGDLVVPSWNGNEFLLPDGRRPTIRTFTPWHADPEALELDVGIVVHGGGVASDWAVSAEPGRPAAISGPGRGYTVDRDAARYLVAGDETAIPAITQVVDAIPGETPVQVRIEVAHADGRVALTRIRRDRRVVRSPVRRASRRRARRRGPGRGPPRRRPGVGRRRSGRRAAHPPPSVRRSGPGASADVGARLLEIRPRR